MAMTTFSALPLTDLQFPRLEYERRQPKVLEGGGARGTRCTLDHRPASSGISPDKKGFDGYFAPFPISLVPGRAPVDVLPRVLGQRRSREAMRRRGRSFYRSAPVCQNAFSGIDRWAEG